MVPSLRALSSVCLHAFSNVKKKELSLGSWSDAFRGGEEHLGSIPDLIYKMQWPPSKSLESLGLLSVTWIFCAFCYSLELAEFWFSCHFLFGGFTIPAVLHPSILEFYWSFTSSYSCSSIFPFPHLLCPLFPTKAEIVVHISVWEGPFNGGQTFLALAFLPPHHKQVQIHWALKS